MRDRKWVKRASGLWSSFDPVILRQIERKAAKEAKEKVAREKSRAAEQ